jgi:hypothetical protein
MTQVSVLHKYTADGSSSRTILFILRAVRQRTAPLFGESLASLSQVCQLVEAGLDSSIKEVP